MRPKKGVELVQDHTRSDRDCSRFQIQTIDLLVVAREIDDEAIPDRAADEARPGAPGRDRTAAASRAVRGNATAAGSTR